MKINLFTKEKMAESFGFVFIFIAFQKFIGLLRGALFARFLGPEHFGVFTMAYLFIDLVAGLALLGIPSSYGRYIPQYEKKGQLRHFFLRTVKFNIISIFSTCILLFIFSRQISKFVFGTDEYQTVIQLSLVTVIGYMFFRLLFNAFRGLRIFKLDTLLQGTKAIFYFLIGVVIVYYRADVRMAIISDIMALAIAISMFVYLIYKNVFRDINQQAHIEDSRFFQKIFRYSIWYALVIIVNGFFNYTDRWMINHYSSLHEVGIYSAIGGITQIIFMMGTVVANVLMPNMSHLWEKGNKKQVIKMINFSLKVTILLLSLGSLGFILVKTPVISKIYGEVYVPGLSLVPLFLTYWLLVVIGWILFIFTDLLEKTYYMFISVCVGLVFNVVLNYLLIPKWGNHGAIIATTISYTMIILTQLLILNFHNLRLSKSTLLICLTPALLIFNPIIAIFWIAIQVVLIFKSNTFFDLDEKQIFLSSISRITKTVTP